jgi:S-adenosylmethionine synthetase
MRRTNCVFSSESVTEGHPDKVCDQVSDAILDDILRQDKLGRVACETFITVGMVIVGGEITTTSYSDIQKVVRDMIREIGYEDERFGFDANTCSVLNAIHSQSPDISQGVDTGGAGDQGIMFGYACDETPELMPLPITLAHKLAKRLAEVRKKKILPYIGPDGKSQVTIEYVDCKPVLATRVVIATQHTEEVVDSSGKNMTKKSREEITKEVIIPVLGKYYDKNKTELFINQTGRFVVGGPVSDTGVTGRKIIVDTYGGSAPHGGGAFSGKDPTKVDRSATYMARYIAKNLVAAGIASELLLQLSYVIGKAEPLSLIVDSRGTSKISDNKIIGLIRENFNLTPRGIIEKLQLRNPIYRKTAAYGHFGRNEKGFTWEKTDMAAVLKKAAKI